METMALSWHVDGASIKLFFEKRLTATLKPVCGKEWMMKIDVTVVSVKKPGIPLIKTCSSRECSSFAG